VKEAHGRGSGRMLEEPARCVLTTGVLEARDALRLYHLNRQAERLRKQLWPDLICLVLAYIVTAAWVIPEMFHDRVTWHAMGSISERQALTWPGLLELGFAGPLTAYWWCADRWR